MFDSIFTQFSICVKRLQGHGVKQLHFDNCLVMLVKAKQML
nr:hypothetical protein [uncultured Emticicia sp.]